MIPLQWKCIKGHEFSRNLNDMKRKNSGCPYCQKRTPQNIEIAKRIALARNGECLSTEYINNKSNLLWRCSKGHEWYACLNSIKNRNSWCQLCSKYKREKLCYNITSKYLGPPSANHRPDFLKTSEYLTGLQHDIPYYHYGFAIEVQGIQHKKYHEFFHRGNPNNLVKQQERDQLKEELCEENWIVLRYVWYYEDPFEKIPTILRELGLIP
ncbi:4015_t:CDS:1 [Entrophospora sp. SA101]|nr:13177_t:CDS:1 [Entrophospora sp. SA101]CAJ0864903.1 4015_t:CDS:1 [Entrophospora sp. SA101]CAJ0918589.1 10615_t:CDS:1 [Entrophospora sp. SA101]